MNSSIKFLNFSPSTTKSSLNTPLAESTAIGSPISRQLYGNSKRKSISPLHNPVKLKSAVKIDPQVLTDAQSTGIVHRLVKYYDNSTSESDRNRMVYNKFGDFPIVQLKKNEIKRPIVRSTSVRIAPPSKSVMNPTLRAAIMRSNSFSMNSGIPKITPTKMRAKDDSHQIITHHHEPIIIDINYTASSKSVLDALEKNCRKRINNEELILDRNKKFCGPLLPQQQAQNASEIDAPAREFIPINSPMSTKRTRDISPIKNTSTLFNDATQPSKKMKTKNNALLCSLSSSHFDLIPHKMNISNSSNKIETPAKRQSTFVSMPPSSSLTSTESTSVKTVESEEKRKEKESDFNVNENLVKKFSKELTTEPVAVSPVVDNKREIPLAEPKRLHLFNYKPDPNSIKNRAKLRLLDKDDDDDDDEVKIRFVKPKESLTETEYNHPGNNLSRMISGLTGGLRTPPYKGNDDRDKDTVDTAEKEKINENVTSAALTSISFSTSTTTSTAAPILSVASPSTQSPGIKSVSFVLPASEEKKNEEKSENLLPTSIDTPKSILKGGFQFGSNTNADVSKNLISFTPIASTKTASSSLNTETVVSTPSVSIIDPNKSLISFTPIEKKTTVSESSNSVVATSAVSTLPTFGAIANANSNSSNLLTGGFKFGASNEPQKVGFSFSSNSAPSINASTSENSTNKLSNISFGTNHNVLPAVTNSLTSTLLPAVTTQALLLNFQSVKPVTTTSSNSGFSFNASATNTSASTPQQGFSFGSNNSISGMNKLSSSPNFSKQPETTVASGVGFSFGASSNKPAMTFGTNIIQSNPISSAATAPSSTFSFGSNQGSSPITNNNTGFTGFSNTQKTESQPVAGIFSFSNQQKPAQPSILSSSQTNNQSAAFNFSSNASNQQTSDTSGGLSFGSKSASSEQQTHTSGGIFARLGEKVTTNNETKPFSFGGNQQQNITSSFGSQNTMITTASAPSFNQSSTFTFGQSSIMGNNSNNNNSADNNLFSQANQQKTQSIFGGNSQSQPQQQAPSSMFAFNAQSNDLKKTNAFSLGGSNASINSASNAFTPAPSSTSIFNSGSNNQSSQNVSASFTFNQSTGGITPSSSPNVFGQNSSAPPPPAYQFRSSNNNNNNNNNNIGQNPSVSFNFSGASTAPSQQQQQTGNAFNFSNSAPVQSQAPFNFQAPSLSQQQQNTGGVFNIGTGGSQNQRRMIRTASRRFK